MVLRPEPTIPGPVSARIDHWPAVPVANERDARCPWSCEEAIRVEDCGLQRCVGVVHDLAMDRSPEALGEGKPSLGADLFRDAEVSATCRLTRSSALVAPRGPMLLFIE